MKVLLAPTVELAQTINADITIEAEYGDYCVEGSLYTAAHHGSRSINPAPCIDKNIPVKFDATVLVSHLDLDTLGGIARILGHSTVYYEFFWELAAYVDINGPHRIMQSKHADPTNVARMYAWWAWSQANRSPRRDNTKIHNVTGEVMNSLEALLKILAGDDEMLEAGRKFMEAEETLEKDSFITSMRLNTRHDIIVRNSDAFVNHLYTSSGKTHDLVLAYNSKTKAITLSKENSYMSLNCCEIMQAVFGPLAGGHAGIAGSPRGVEFTPSQMNDVLEYIDHLYDLKVDIDLSTTDEVVVLDTIDYAIPDEDRFEDIRVTYKVTGENEVTFYGEGVDGKDFHPWEDVCIKENCPTTVYVDYSLKRGYFDIVYSKVYTDGITKIIN